MARVFCLLMLVMVGMVFADDEDCSELGDCDCGNVCKDGQCTPGCQVYDVFVKAGTERTVYGRRCQCGADQDTKGRAIMCAEGESFEGNPTGFQMYVANPKCSDDEPTAAPTEAVVAEAATEATPEAPII
ncbi:uncharacterized protein LOC128235463 [Mya arenaria]|uniref:uncharacterized protein LOC128235463 n=1 Tax=Mya arenaria TaxID=6604 RepID=UPI0022E270DF|nr:uncharacterized protein LOC128235463 [Mya arenaria]